MRPIVQSIRLPNISCLDFAEMRSIHEKLFGIIPFNHLKSGEAGMSGGNDFCFVVNRKKVVYFLLQNRTHNTQDLLQGPRIMIFQFQVQNTCIIVMASLHRLGAWSFKRTLIPDCLLCGFIVCSVPLKCPVFPE